jgi:hypothetical protein
MPGRKREYLPSGLTPAEKRNPFLRRKISHCVRRVERSSCPRSARKAGGKFDYRKCRVNPVAVCRASVRR